MLLVKIFDKLLVGKNPPEEINVNDKFNELNVLTLNKFKIIKILRVNSVYKIKILKVCFKVSDLLNEIKFVKDYLKILSKISISKIMENKK